MNKLFYISFLFLLFSCQEEVKEPEQSEINWNKAESSKLSKKFAKQEEVDINLFLGMRPDWKMEKTGSGLRYWIYEEGDGDSLKSGQIAEVEYSVKLLDGTECYRTDEGMYSEIVVDHSEVETGMQEALKLMRVGNRAKFIIPSHIGHGLLGDLDKIPPQRTLVIDLTLLGIAK